ncbi:MAG TPA: MaoC family dehydratase [Novosphingobium sp.]|nr:MaoC family dehydratase [Novosphingobium sp.]
MDKQLQVVDLVPLVGTVLGISDWMVVDQPLIDAFAQVTGDHEFLHVDPVAAAATPLGGTIAHGLLTLSLLPALFNASCPRPACRMTVNYGYDAVRFLSPVPVGSRLRGAFRLVELVERKPGEWRQSVAASVEIEGAERPALVATWLCQHFA